MSINFRSIYRSKVSVTNSKLTVVTLKKSYLINKTKITFSAKIFTLSKFFTQVKPRLFNSVKNLTPKILFTMIVKK